MNSNDHYTTTHTRASNYTTTHTLKPLLNLRDGARSRYPELIEAQAQAHLSAEITPTRREGHIGAHFLLAFGSMFVNV